MAAARFVFAGAILLAWRSRARAARSSDPSRREWRDSPIVGAVLLGGGNGLVAFGEQTVPSGIAALLVGLMPVWVAILGGIFFGDRLPRLAVVGIAIGFAGVAILSVRPLGGGRSLEPIGLTACLLAPIGWALGSLYATKRAVMPRHPLLATGYQMLGGALVALVLAAVTGELFAVEPAAVSRDSLLAMAYLTIVGSLVGYTTYGWLLRVAPISRVTTYAYVNPIVAVVLGALVLSEPIKPRTVVAAA